MGKAVITIIIGLTWNLSVAAQQWESLLEDSIGFVYSTGLDEDQLIFSDQLATRAMPNQVHVFNGSNWSVIADSTIGQGANPIRGVCMFQENPYCYHFSSTNGSGVFRFNGLQWQLIGEMLNGGVKGMNVHDDTLYVFGEFREINGDTNLRYVVKYDGQEFHPVGTALSYRPEVGLGPIVKDIHFFSGDLYVVGDIKTPSGKYHIARWDGQQWNDVGSGFPYGSYPSKLEEYNGYLMVNQHPVSYNGTANGLIAWDGQQFYGMGQITCEHPAGVSHMTVHDGKLWVAGDCSEPLPGFHHYFASYDGERWCRYDFVEKTKYMTVFQDRMYAYLLHYPNGPVHRFVRWLEGTEPDWCGEEIHIGIDDVETENIEFSIHPNPTTTTTTTLTWQAKNHNNYQLHLYDVHGRKLLHRNGTAAIGKNTLTLDMGNYAKGIYFGRLLLVEERPFGSAQGKSFKVVRE